MRLATLDSKSEAWKTHRSDVANLLVDTRNEDIIEWVKLLGPVRSHLMPAMDVWVEDSLATDSATSDETDARRQVTAAAILLLFGNEDPYWRLLRASSNPQLRTLAIHETPGSFIDADRLLAHLRGQNTDAATRQACLLMLGQTSVPSQAVQQLLTDLHKNDSDPGVHSAAEWLMRKLDLPVVPVTRSLETVQDEIPTWYTDVSGHTMVAVWIEFDDLALRVEASDHADVNALPRLVAMSTREETQAQFARFDDRVIEGNPHAAVNMIGLQDAMAYCNWLSERERIPKVSGATCKRSRTSSASKTTFSHLRDTGFLPDWNGFISARQVRTPRGTMANRSSCCPSMHGSENALLNRLKWGCCCRTGWACSTSWETSRNGARSTAKARCYRPTSAHSQAVHSGRQPP